MVLLDADTLHGMREDDELELGHRVARYFAVTYGSRIDGMSEVENWWYVNFGGNDKWPEAKMISRKPKWVELMYPLPF